MNDGGFAFPATVQMHKAPENNYGMSLRDYFAAAALTGLVSSDATDEWDWKEVADGAYAYADAMLAARAPKEAS